MQACSKINRSMRKIGIVICNFSEKSCSREKSLKPGCNTLAYHKGIEQGMKSELKKD